MSGVNAPLDPFELGVNQCCWICLSLCKADAFNCVSPQIVRQKIFRKIRQNEKIRLEKLRENVICEHISCENCFELYKCRAYAHKGHLFGLIRRYV